MGSKLWLSKLVVLKESRFAAGDVVHRPEPIGMGSMGRVVVLGPCSVVSCHWVWACDVPPGIRGARRRTRMIA